MKRAIIVIAVLLALGAVVFFSIRAGDRKKAIRIYLEEVEHRDISRLVKASGEIDPRIKVNLSAHVIARIEKLFVEEGDSIEVGDPVLELEKEAFVAIRDRAVAELSIARSRLRQAEIELEDNDLKLQRMQRLADELVVSSEQLESAQLQHKSAELKLEQSREAVIQAQASLDKAEDDLSKTTIFAPLSGRVIELRAEEGEVVVSGTMNNPASVIGIIADLSEILAVVDVDETEVAFLELGQSTELDVDALPDSTYTGRVVEIGSSGFQRNRQPDVTFFKVKVLLDDPDEVLRPGMSVRARMNTAEQTDVLVAPIQAVVDRPPLADEDEPEEKGDEAVEEQDEIRVVFVVDDEVARQRAVETGLSDETHVEIVSGLEAGEKVVTGPYRSLKDLEDGDPIKLRKQGSDENEDED
ncbi:MAG: efflux RND transporter periplasmic adaptor subunit [Acidobacteria bacterium]|nr:MAG: efflux RND transporter periplasmic adaptor subunit [Acidobacteriota bacterium]